MSKQATVQTQTTARPTITPKSAGLLQRQCACGPHNTGGECEECKKKRESTLQRAAISSSPVHDVPPIVHEVLRSPGQPLDPATRTFMESRFGHDFSRVRVHTDAKAAESARAVNARAYTVGSDVVFGAGGYAQNSIFGQNLLAHELAHVVQQNQSAGTPYSAAAAEKEADQAATRAVTGQPVSVHTTVKSGIQRQAKPGKAPDVRRLVLALEDNIGENLADFGHHFYRISTLYPDQPDLLEEAFSRYALGLNVLETSYQWAGFEPETAEKLALGTGILFKGYTLLSEGEFVYDYQIELGSGMKLEASIDLALDPNFEDVKKTKVDLNFVGLGLVGRF